MQTQYLRARDALVRLEGAGIIPQAAPALARSAATTGAALRAAVLAESPAFASSGNPDVLPGLERHGAEHIGEILRLMGGGDFGDLGFVASHARLRAEQRFPLEATLHAYRCGHRVLSHWLREASLALAPAAPDQVISDVADFAIEYTNAISTVAAAEYVEHTRRMTEAESGQRAEQVSLLLDGYDEGDGRVARILRRGGFLDQRQAYCVVAAQPVNLAELEHPARAQRIAAAIAEALAGTGLRLLTGTRNGAVVAILSGRRRQSGWTPAEESIGKRATHLLDVLGPAVLAGVSADHPSTSYLPRALQEAMTALGFATVTRRVVAFAALPVRDLLVNRGAAQVRAAAPTWVADFNAADRQVSGTLIATLRALADADMNLQQAARLLGRHGNTVYARLQRIRDVTGKDPARYHDLTELLLAADCWEG